MELRKIISFGNSSYVISLPKAWVVRNRLKKGDLIEVDEKPTELTLAAQDKGERKTAMETTIESGSKSSARLESEIVSAYLSNYNIIIINGLEGKERHAEVKKVLDGLMGMEIIEETAAKIMVKDLLDITEVSLDKIIRRVDILTRTMYTDALLSGRAVDVTERDEEVNRQAFLGYRVVKAAFDNPRIAKTFEMSNIDLLLARRVLTHIEHFADDLKRMSRVVSRSPEAGKGFSKIYKLIYDKYLEVMKIYYTQDKESAFRIGPEIKKLFAESEKPLKRCRDLDSARIVEHLKGMINAVSVIQRCVTDYRY